MRDQLYAETRLVQTRTVWDRLLRLDEDDLSRFTVKPANQHL